MANNIAIRVENVSKDFVLPHEQVRSIKRLFTNLAKGRHRKTKEVQHALEDISFEVKEGEFFGIVGRNGSGKSTLLKILAGIYQPTSGQISTKGKLVPFIELGVGFNPELSGRENVFLNGAMLGFSEKEVAAMYDDIVAFAELERFMDQKLKNYSSGMQVRLAFSMATRSQADILLIDEVLAVGDADFQRKCFDYFKQLKKNRKTVVFVSHDMSAVREYCDRAMLIESSKLVEIGGTDKIAEKYTRLFIPSPQQTDNTVVDNNDNADRWGNGHASTIKVKARSDTSSITISQFIKAQVDIESYAIGFRIRDAAGKNVTGTNNKIEKIKLPPMKKGQGLNITWRMPAVLSDGEYTVDPAIVSGDGVTVMDWWNDAASFTVRKDRHIPYSIDPGFTLEIEKS
ncbi:MAG TPA: ABC transporter ATP-binding protein [Candidatus Saccharimonadales bacterium]|nr:ABC transporter ATP-binding protein [Candidatus Saccharimonadales bacterium]